MLIVLDSAGGVGHMEFQITDELINNKNYYILLNDTHHLKHFRGYDIIKIEAIFLLSKPLKKMAGYLPIIKLSKSKKAPNNSGAFLIDQFFLGGEYLYILLSKILKNFYILIFEKYYLK